MRGLLLCFLIDLYGGVSRNPAPPLETQGLLSDLIFSAMKNPHYREVLVVRDLPLNLMREIGRVIFFHSYLEWRLGLIIYDILRVTKVLSRLVARDSRTMDQFDLICDLVSLKDVKTGVDLMRLRKSLISATTQRDLLAHGTWVKDPKTKVFLLRLVGGGWKPVKNKKMKTKRSMKLEASQYGIEECRSLSQLINGIIVNVDDLYLDTLGQPAASRQKLH